MSNLKGVFIDFKNLTDEEQLELWDTLHAFADKKLPAENKLVCVAIEKKTKVRGAGQ